MLKIGITWLCTLLLAGFLIAAGSSARPVTMSILPEVPKTGEPVVATFNLNNPSDARPVICFKSEMFDSPPPISIIPLPAARK